MSQYNGEDPKQWSAGLIPNSSAGSWGLNHDASRSFRQARQRKLRHDGESRRKHSSQHKVNGLAGVDVLNQAAGFEEAPSLSIFFICSSCASRNQPETVLLATRNLAGQFLSSCSTLRCVHPRAKRVPPGQSAAVLLGARNRAGCKNKQVSHGEPFSTSVGKSLGLMYRIIEACSYLPISFGIAFFRPILKNQVRKPQVHPDLLHNRHELSTSDINLSSTNGSFR